MFGRQEKAAKDWTSNIPVFSWLGRTLLPCFSCLVGIWGGWKRLDFKLLAFPGYLRQESSWEIPGKPGFSCLVLKSQELFSPGQPNIGNIFSPQVNIWQFED